MLLINCSNREKNCFKILNDIKGENDTLLSLSHKKMDFCLGCERCAGNIENHCVLDDYITNTVYDEIIANDKVVIACPMYYNTINAILKNLIDRMGPFYHHRELLRNKKLYLILIGQGSYYYNEDKINNVINYFKELSKWLFPYFEFLGYFKGFQNIEEENYERKINEIKETLANN